MNKWTVQTKPVLGDNRIYSTHIDSTELGLFYVINGDEVYPLDSWTPEEAEEHYLSPESAEERDIAFRQAYGFYD